jgi:predicted phage terminase large subunit-like protein
MSRTSSPEPIRQPKPRVELPPLHPAQQEVAEHPARFKVVVCGRQWGKTLLGASMCVGAALEGGDVWWVAPSFPIGELGWREIDNLCRQVNAGIGGVRFEGRPVFRITLPTGGSIQLRSADNPDSLRGATLDGVVFDEAAQAKPEAWPTLEPTLAIRGGWAMFISTPRGLNWFADLYEDAGVLEDWHRWQLPSASSPYMTQKALEQAKQRQGSLYFSQEYGAEFISGGTGRFQAEWIQHYFTRFEGESKVYVLGDEPVAESSLTKFHTVDLAWTQHENADYTVISSWGATRKKHLLLLDVIRGRFEGPDILPKLQLAYAKHGGVFAIEKASRGISIIQDAQRSGLAIRALSAHKDKEARALLPAAQMEAGRVWFPPASTPWYREIEEELLAFPAGRHDDFVDTLSYAAAEMAASGTPRGIEWV